MTFPSFTPSLTALIRATGTAESLFLTLLPHGGQGTARRNAWLAMSGDVAQAKARREAEQAVAVAAARAASRAAHPAAR